MQNEMGKTRQVVGTDPGFPAGMGKGIPNHVPPTFGELGEACSGFGGRCWNWNTPELEYVPVFSEGLWSLRTLQVSPECGRQMSAMKDRILPTSCGVINRSRCNKDGQVELLARPGKWSAQFQDSCQKEARDP